MPFQISITVPDSNRLISVLETMNDERYPATEDGFRDFLVDFIHDFVFDAEVTAAKKSAVAAVPEFPVTANIAVTGPPQMSN